MNAGRNESLLSHLHIYFWKSRVLQSVHLNPKARLMLPERREETSVNGEVVKPACDDMAAVIETPRILRDLNFKKTSLGFNDGSGGSCRGA